MKNIILKTIFLTVVLMNTKCLLAANYYFSSLDGDDSRNSQEAQNPSTPWKSIEKLNDIFHTLKPGDGVYFKRGETFYGTIHVSKSGTSAQPITIGAYGSGTKPRISALVFLTNWKQLSSGVFEADDPLLNNERVNVVLMNNALQEMGRFPNRDTVTYKKFFNVDQSTSTSITSQELPLSTNWEGGEVVIRKNYWIVDRHTISSHSGNTLMLAPAVGTSYTPTNDYGFFIQNHPQTLDRRGEWYYNPASRKLSFYFGSTPPSTVDVAVGTLDYLVTNSNWNIKHVTFDNLHFVGANKSAFHLQGGNDVRITNCDIEFSGIDAVAVEGTSNLVFEGNQIVRANNNGMTLKSTPNAVIRNNKIQDVLLLPGLGQNGDGNGFGIYSPNENNLIEYNQIFNIGYVGIRFGGNNSVVKNNLVENFSLTKNDGGGIYVYTGKSNTTYKNRKVIGNIILNGIGAREATAIRSEIFKPQSEGIYLDDNTTGVEVAHNTIANISNKGIYLHNARENNIHDNLIYNTKYQLAVASDHLGEDVRDNDITGNMFVAKTAEQYNLNISSIKDDIDQMGRFDNNIYANPLTDGYRILATSQSNTSQEVAENLNLKGWQENYGLDINSKINPHVIPQYKTGNTIGENKYPNGSFDKSTHVSVNGGTSIWKANSSLDGGAIEIKGNGTFDMIFNVGKITEDQLYLLRFSAVGAKEFPVKAYLRYNKAPWLPVTPQTSFDLKTERGEYELLMTPNTSLDVAYLMLKVENVEDANFTIDNVQFHEAEMELINPDETILFEVNPSKTEKTVYLDGDYVDVHNQSYSGSVKVEPFGSVILAKIDYLPAEQVPPVVKIASPTNDRSFDFGAAVEIQADVSYQSGQISKVEFFKESTLIKTITSLPYAFTLSDLPADAHSITALVTDNLGRRGLSETVRFNVEEPTVDPPSPPTLPEDGNNGFIPILLNTGSSEDVDYQGMKFVGDNILPLYLGEKNLPIYYNSSSTYSNSSASNDKLMQTERNGKNVQFSIPVPNGKYTVTTYHNELWFGRKGPTAQAGRRVFDIELEGQSVKDDFDIFLYNENKPTALFFDDIEVKDGVLNLELIASVNNATISGLRIERVEAVILPYSLYLNAGSSSTATWEGKSFTGDQNHPSYYNSNSTYSNSKASEHEVYQTERNGKVLSYEIPIPNGIYTVKTLHNELWFGEKGPSAKAGRRVFDISLEGNLVKKDFDIFQVGGNQPTVLTFKNVEVEDGALNLDMSASANNVSLSGISIEGFYLDDGSNLGLALTAHVEEAQLHGIPPTRLYPNPAQEEAMLEVATEVRTILIHTVNGQLIKSIDPQMIKSSRGKYSISLHDIPSGVYLVSLVNNKEIVERIRLIIN